jgi:hypothetical protein
MIERRMTHHAMNAVFALMGMSRKGEMVRRFEKNIREWETDVVLITLCRKWILTFKSVIVSLLRRDREAIASRSRSRRIEGSNLMR